MNIQHERTASYLYSLFETSYLYRQYLNKEGNDEYMNRLNFLQLISEISRNEKNLQIMNDEFKKELEFVTSHTRIQLSNDFIHQQLDNLLLNHFMISFEDRESKESLFKDEDENEDEEKEYYYNYMNFYIYLYNLIHTNISFQIINGSNCLCQFVSIEHMNDITEEARTNYLRKSWKFIKEYLNMIRDGLNDLHLLDMNFNSYYDEIVLNTFENIFNNNLTETNHSSLTIHLTNIIYRTIINNELSRDDANTLNGIINAFFKFARNNNLPIDE